MRTTPRTARVWKIKVSTLCNLRYRYCYEWDRLGDTERMALPVWDTIFRAIADLRTQEAESGPDRIIWHGGEPSLLPPDEVLQVLALQRDLLGDALDAQGVCNAVQTNLYKWNETIDIFASACFDFSVSIDMAPGARLTAGGRDAEEESLRNLKRLVARGASVGVILVLGRHNRDRLAEAHDRFAGIGVNWLRIVPAFKPENAAPVGDLLLSPREAVSALMGLEDHRARVGRPTPVTPLDRARAAADRFRRGETMQRDTPRRIIVQPDGRIGFRIGERLSKGDWPGDGSLASAASQPKTNEREDRMCQPCQYRTACTGRALEDAPDTGDTGPCPIEARLLSEMTGGRVLSTFSANRRQSA